MPEIDLDEVKPGDVIIGALPVHIIAEVNRRSARYLHLALDVPLEARGRELSAEEMRSYGCRLAEYWALPIGSTRSSADREGPLVERFG